MLETQFQLPLLIHGWMEVSKNGLIREIRKITSKMRGWIYRGNYFQQQKRHVLHLIHCLSINTLVELYFLIVPKLPVRTHCHAGREKMSIEHEFDVDVIKQHLSNMAVTRHIYTKTCSSSLYIAYHHFKKISSLNLSFQC